MVDSNFFVIKRNNTQENFNLDKIHAMVERACDGLTGVSVSDVEMKAQLLFHNGITTTEIHRSLTKAAQELITETNPNYQYVAGRLLNYDIRKTAWGGMTQPRLYDHVVRMVNDNYYHEDLLKFYSESDWDKMDSFVDHDRDLNMSYIGVNEYVTKYAVRNRSLNEIIPLETPQITYVLIAAMSAMDTRQLKDVRSFYNDFSQWNIGLPTPIMAGLRSPTKQYSSCCLIATDDNLNSLTDTSAAIVKYASKKAGIGVDASRIRAEGSVVGKEKATKHTGVTPFLKFFEGRLKSCRQGSIRGASATITLCLWHMEAENLLVLKNNKGTPDTRVRKVDYSFQINNYLYNRFINNEHITLFSPHDVPDLYDAFFKDGKLFAKLYEKYEKSNIRKKKVNARELFTKLMIERKETGRIYIFNVDNVNNHSNFKVPVTQSNLCQEILLPTVPMATKEKIRFILKRRNPDFEKELMEKNSNPNYESVKMIYIDEDIVELEVIENKSEIRMCTLASINLGNIRSLDSLESICRNAVRMLDNLLDYQTYMVPAAENSTKKYRPLGIGITNLAYYLAKNGCTYSSQDGLKLIHDTIEAIEYYCIKASIQLAKERGTCLAYNDTKWSDGIMPIDHYNKNVDEIISHNLNLDWEWLREELKKYGIRNTTLTRMMPVESSSKVFNSTNGVEPVRSLITTKGNKDHTSKQVVPEITRLKNKYDFLWDMKSMEGIIKMMAVIQKFTCQSISTNLSYNPLHYGNGEIPLSVMLRDILLCNKYGLKTLYYHNTNDLREIIIEDSKETVVEEEKLDNEETECESCSI